MGDHEELDGGGGKGLRLYTFENITLWSIAT